MVLYKLLRSCYINFKKSMRVRIKQRSTLRYHLVDNRGSISHLSEP
jgi:hypothetical protein